MPPWNHQAEPWLAAIQQLRNTMLIRHCLGDYNQRLGEAALKWTPTVEWGGGEDGEAEVQRPNMQPGHVQN